MSPTADNQAVMSAEDDHVKLIASAAGRAAAREMLLLLGIDASTPAGVQQAQRDFSFLRDLRLGTSAVKRRIALSLFGAIVTAFFAYVALGVRPFSGGH